MKKIAIYPGSFDPITNGHLSIIQRASGIFDEIIIAVARNSQKKGALFTLDERLEQLDMLSEKIKTNTALRAMSFDGLLIDFAKTQNACAIVRGVRNAHDAAYEQQMIHMNRHLSGIETVLLFTTPELSFVSSSLVKEVAKYGGDVSAFIPEEILPVFLDRIAEAS